MLRFAVSLFVVLLAGSAWAFGLAPGMKGFTVREAERTFSRDVDRAEARAFLKRMTTPGAAYNDPTLEADYDAFIARRRARFGNAGVKGAVPFPVGADLKLPY